MPLFDGFSFVRKIKHQKKIFDNRATYNFREISTFNFFLEK